MKISKKVVSSIMMIFLVSGFAIQSTSADETQDLQDVRSGIIQLQEVDPNLPWGASGQKGIVGTLLSKLFHNNGKIKQIFLHEIFGELSGGKIVYYDNTNKTFIDSIISSSPLGISVGGGLLGGFIANFTGDVNITGNLEVGGTITASDPTEDDELATKAYVDNSTVSISNATTTSTGVIQLSGDIGGTYDNIQLAINSVGNSELIDSPTVTQLNVTAGNGNGVKLWNGSDAFKIHMGTGSAYQYGPVTGYSIKNNIDTTPGRGWTWGSAGLTPVAAIESATGNAQFKGNVTSIDPTQPLHLATKQYVDAHEGYWENDGGNEIAYKGDNADVKLYSYDSSHPEASPDFETVRYRGTEASPAAVQSGDSLGKYMFRGSDGSGDHRTAYIGASARGTISDGNIPTDIEFVLDPTGQFPDESSIKMIIESDGGVGIGDDSPDNGLKLDVEGKLGASEYCDENGNNCRDILDLSPFWDSDTGNDIKLEGDNADVRMYSYSDNGGGKADLEFLRARGTNSSPNIVQDGDNVGSIRWMPYDGSEHIVTANISAEIIGNPTTNNVDTDLVFSVSDSDLYSQTGDLHTMVIQSSGEVGIGVNDPNYLLHVNGSAGKSGGGSWSNSSDIRLKDLTGEYEYGLSEINNLRPVRFTYKEDNARDLSSDTKEIGFVAQEVGEVIPDAVSEGTDGYLDFNMHSINVALVNAVKELFSMFTAENAETDTEIENLELHVKNLESEIETLKDIVQDLKEQIQK